MSKLSVFVVEQNREALSDGRVVERATVDLKGVHKYHWQCVCTPEDCHDHDALIGVIASGLANRQEVLKAFEALVGQQITVGGTTATITDANIQIRGPMDWPLYVAWKYEDGRMEEKVYHADAPLKTPHPDVVLSDAQAAVAKSDKRRLDALALARFDGEKSDLDPLAPVEEPIEG